MSLIIKAGPDIHDYLVIIQGDLDLYATAEVNGCFKEILENGAKRIVLDLQDLVYLDSSGVGVLIRLLQNAAGLSVAVGVSGLGGTPKKVLQLCNVITLLKLFDRPQDAWAQLGKK